MKKTVLTLILIIMFSPFAAIYAAEGTSSLELVLKLNSTTDYFDCGISTNIVLNSSTKPITADGATIYFEMEQDGSVNSITPIYLYWQIFSPNQYIVEVLPIDMKEGENILNYNLLLTKEGGNGNLIDTEVSSLSADTQLYHQVYETSTANRVDFGCVKVNFKIPDSVDINEISINPYTADLSIRIKTK